uniref:Reverse transcriptase domain-containing protein n=1 Tax=Haemonchus contortus TaxID=6289 RepID=A0A7I4XRT7_HAECO
MGRPQTSRTKIEEMAVSYYTNLFRSTVSVSRTPTPTQEGAPRIEEWEVERAIRQMKPRKAPRPDRISADFLKSASHTIIKQLTKRFNKYLDAQRIPDQWKKSNTVLLFKKGERDQMKNYRPIALLSQPYKLFTKIILNRLERQLDEYQPVERAGFRKGFCCMDHIHTIMQLIERTREYKQPLILCFIDYAKAFDSVEHNSVWNALHHAGVDPCYINLLEQCNTDTFTTIRMFQRELRVPIEKGVRQGDTISPKLFTTALNHAKLQLDWDDTGINIDGRKLSNLRFADDIVLISQKPRGAAADGGGVGRRQQSHWPYDEQEQDNGHAKRMGGCVTHHTRRHHVTFHRLLCVPRPSNFHGQQPACRDLEAQKMRVGRQSER